MCLLAKQNFWALYIYLHNISFNYILAIYVNTKHLFDSFIWGGREQGFP